MLPTHRHRGGKGTEGPKTPASDYGEFRRIRRQLGLALLALAVVILIGIVGFTIIGRGEHDLIDAVYMTIITLTTVGFGEIIDLSASPAGRMFTIGLLLCGMGIMAYTVMLVAAFLIEGQLRHVFARRRMERRIARMEGHYIICGETAAVWYVAEELTRTTRDVVMVVPDQEALEEIQQRLGEVPVIVGDPSDDEVLVSAGVAHAAGAVFCMDSDRESLLGVLTARRLAPDIRIIAGTELPEFKLKLLSAGANSVVSTSRIGGLRMASELVRPTVVTFLDQMLRDTQSNLRVEEVSVPDDYTADRTLDTLGMEDIPGVLLVALVREEGEDFEFKPSPSTRLEPGMTLIVMSDSAGREALEGILGSA